MTDRGDDIVKKGQTLLKTMAQRLDIPEEIVANLPVTEVAGFSRITVEHHKGLLEYTGESIVLQVNIGTIHITGQALEIALMNADLVVVTGTIWSVAFSDGGK